MHAMHVIYIWVVDTQTGVIPQGVVDISLRFNYGITIGVKQAIALLFGRQFIKSKKVSRSNWTMLPYTPAQVLYAANDAWAALRVHQALVKEGFP
jgi:ribonuclease D